MTGVGMLAATAGLLAGCGGDDNDRTPALGASRSSQAPSTAAAAPESTVGIIEDEYSIKLATATGSSRDGSITFIVKNAGEVAHEFAVIKTGKKADALLHGQEADEKGDVGEIENIPPGRSAKLTLKLPQGHYALICNLPGHYMPHGNPGMLADFTVT